MTRVKMGALALWLGGLAATSAPGLAQTQRTPPSAASAAAAEAAIDAEHDEVGRLYREGRYADALQRAAKVAERAERELGAEHRSTLTGLSNLALLYHEQGQPEKAEALYLTALATKERVLGPDHPDTIAGVSNLASLYYSQDRYAEAEPLQLRALTAQQRVLGPEHPDTLSSLNNLAAVYEAQGRYAEANPIYQQVLAVRERLLGFMNPETLRSLAFVANAYQLQGRYSEAERLYLRALDARERALGIEHRDTLASVNDLAGLYAKQGRHVEAAQLYGRALAVRERVLGRDHPETLESVNKIGAMFYAAGGYADAEPYYRRAFESRERVLGADHAATVVSVTNLAALYDSQGRHADAESLYARALRSQERVFGAEHPFTIELTRRLAVSKLTAADPSALQLADAALTLTRKRVRLGDDFRGQQTEPEDAIAIAAYVYARAAWAAGERPPIEKSFEALQLAGPTSVGTALARSAALASLDQAGQALVLERERVAAEIDAIDGAFASAAGTEGGGMALTDLQAQRKTLEIRLEAIEGTLEAGYPRYFELIRPQPVPLEALRNGAAKGLPLLRADEALILLTTGHSRFPEGHRRGFVFAVTREGSAWAELPLDPVPLAELITEVREGSAIIDPRVQQPVPRKRAKALYDALFGAPEIARLIAGKPSWIVSPQGHLLSTPFAALVTRDPTGDDDDPEAWAGTAWLGAERALAILPEVHMLRALRGLDRAAGGASAPYFGIADPAFEGRGNGVDARSAASFFRGALGSPDAIIKLTPLPNTRTEVETVARALGAGPETLLTGRGATEAALRARASQLADSRVIHFATHALVAGEMGGLTQPALALMPPTGTATVEESNDGLLTAAEAATLKLNADWVILSACNTAAGEDSAAEGLSGLARSFFYAGAASLLVSQWKVRDDSGAMLVAETVKAFAAGGVSRAEALRQAIRKVAASKNARGESFAHPQDWASFMLVGVDR